MRVNKWWYDFYFRVKYLLTGRKTVNVYVFTVFYIQYNLTSVTRILILKKRMTRRAWPSGDQVCQSAEWNIKQPITALALNLSLLCESTGCNVSWSQSSHARWAESYYHPLTRSMTYCWFILTVCVGVCVCYKPTSHCRLSYVSSDQQSVRVLSLTLKTLTAPKISPEFRKTSPYTCSIISFLLG